MRVRQGPGGGADDGTNHGYMRLTVARLLPGATLAEIEVILDVGPEEFATILEESEKVAIFEWGRYKPEGWAYGSEEHRRIAVLLTAHGGKIVERDALETSTKRRGQRSSRSSGPTKLASSPMGRAAAATA